MKKIIPILSLGILWGCSHSNSNINITYLEHHTDNISHLSRITQSPDGEVYISWVETNLSSSALYFSKFNDNQWSKKTKVSYGDNWFVNWADYPSLSVDGDHMKAHWLVKSGDGAYDYDIHFSVSNNKGLSWGKPKTAHKDGVKAEHGFVSMLPLGDGNTMMTWLDGRYSKPTHNKLDSTSTDHHHNNSMTLRAGLFDKDGTKLNSWELDKKVCDCCTTGITMTSNGPAVIYRDRTDEERRDISITHYSEQNETWSKPVNVHNDGWIIPGCPVNGPSIQSIDNNVYASWFTAAKGYGELKLAISEDHGENFAEPITISDQNTVGRVSLAANDDFVVATYLEDSNGHSNLISTVINRDGSKYKTIILDSIMSGRSSGFPSSTLTSDGRFFASWTSVDEDDKNQVITANFYL